MTIEIKKENAERAINMASDELRPVLLEMLGIDNRSIYDKLKSFEDACYIKGVHPNDVLPYPTPANEEQEVMNAYAKQRLIAQVLRGDWTPDWDDSSVRKWRPWFNMTTAGFGFSHSYCGRTGSNAGGGSRLCFPSEEMSDYFGKQFIDIHKITLTK